LETVIKKNSQPIFSKGKVATSFFSRFMGLMGKKQMEKEEALIFPHCNSIHTCFMRIDIDVIFVSPQGKVIKIFHRLKPWRFLMPVKGAKHVIEIESGACEKKNIKDGDFLICDEVFG
jgi:uncharacterized membrane protein (UPF0127 family)